MNSVFGLTAPNLLGLICALTTLVCATARAQDDVHHSPVYVPVDREIRDTSPRDINAESDFSVAAQVANRYLAVTIEVTKTSITPTDAVLVRGPQRSNSSAADLWVSVSGPGVLASRYRIADPRLQKLEDGAWEASDSAEKVIVIPLSALIERVIVAPTSTTRGAVVSAGGTFDPRPWATLACTGADPGTYPECAAVLDLGIPPPP